MHPLGYVLFIPVACLAYGLGMLHCRYIIGRWPEKNGFKRISARPTP